MKKEIRNKNLVSEVYELIKIRLSLFSQREMLSKFESLTYFICLLKMMSDCKKKLQFL